MERASRKLARNTFYGMARWQGRLENKQAFLGRIVDIGCELFAMTAAVVRAKMIAEDDPAHGSEAAALAELFCQQSRLRVETLFDGLTSNNDSDNYKAAMRTMSGDFAWLEARRPRPVGGELGLSQPEAARAPGAASRGRAGHSRPGRAQAGAPAVPAYSCLIVSSVTGDDLRCRVVHDEQREHARPAPTSPRP